MVQSHGKYQGKKIMIEKPLEIDLWKEHSSILGIDEAGRGPIAGPLVVAGACFEKGYTNAEIDDSKKLSEKKRERLFEQIQKDAIWFQIEVIDEETIDQLNIYQATKQAMERIASCAPCTYILSDAMPLAIEKEYEAIVKGDQKSISIAAASILAKVTRDHIMLELDQQYPAYGFKKHKGYPTKQHLEALHQYGVLPCHRKSYGPVSKELEIRLF